MCRLERVVRRDGKETKGAAYAITSAGPELACAATLLGRWRGHWGSENGLHWVRNVTMGEDKSHIRTGAAHEVMAGLHKAAITLLRLAGAANIAQALCENANHASEALT